MPSNRHDVKLGMTEKQSAFLTVKYKLHNSSQRRRAHLGYDKILKAVRSDVEAIAGMDERKERYEGYRLSQHRLQALARPLPLGNGPKQDIIFDAMAQAESYVELKRADNNTQSPLGGRF